MTNEEKQIIARNVLWTERNNTMKKQSDSSRRSEAFESYSNEIKNRKQNPTAEESLAAMEAQMPHVRSEDAPPTALQRVSTFKQLAKVSRSARLTFGSNGQWIQAKSLFNESYRGGIETPPFFITKAFRYKSKEIAGPRMGIEIVMSNGRAYIVGLGVNENDSKRNAILSAFERETAEPIGPFVFIPLPTGKGNDYYDLQPFDQAATHGADIEIPFVEIDEELPF